jgi:Zn finger protein HypA/HybF involved in hydrogenase expression
MRLRSTKDAAAVMSGVNIFTNMQSLLKPTSHDVVWPISLQLPSILISPLEGEEKRLPEASKHIRRIVLDSDHCSSGILGNGFVLPCFSELLRRTGAEGVGVTRKRRKGKKKAWVCKHHVKLHYAKGLCKTCYLQQYQLKRTQQDQSLILHRSPTPL